MADTRKALQKASISMAKDGPHPSFRHQRQPNTSAAVFRSLGNTMTRAAMQLASAATRLFRVEGPLQSQVARVDSVQGQVFGD